MIIRFIGKTIVNSFLLYGAGALFPESVRINDALGVLVFSAAVLAMLNMFLQPILRVITLPIRWLTLGLFSVVIYVVILWLADILLSGIAIQHFGALILLSIVIAVANSII